MDPVRGPGCCPCLQARCSLPCWLQADALEHTCLLMPGRPSPSPAHPPQCEYLGAPERSITLNFSKSATNIVAQYYQVPPSRD